MIELPEGCTEVLDADDIRWTRESLAAHAAAVRAQVTEEIATAIEEQLVQPNPCNDADDACAACAPLHRAARIARQYAVKPPEDAVSGPCGGHAVMD